VTIRDVSRHLARLRAEPSYLITHIVYRAYRRVRARGLRKVYGRVVAHPRAHASFEPLPVALPPIDRLPPLLSQPAEDLRADADRALARQFDLLGSDLMSLGPQIEWDRDFRSGVRWSASFYQDVKAIDPGNDGDAKVPWELSRCHHFLSLARSGVLFDERRYVDELEAQLGSWIAANPAGVGINWVNAMEVALRATNWVWALSALGGIGGLDPELRPEIRRSLQVHGRHIATNLEGTPHLRSNHFLADILGLLVLGVALAEDSAAKRWQRRARRAFERQIHRQVLSDGVGFEASLGYPGLALEIFLIAWWVCRTKGRPLSAAYEKRLRQMLVVSLAVRHPDGRIPAFGDADDGRVLPATPARAFTHDHLLWAGAALLGTPRPSADLPNAEVAWNYGPAAWAAARHAPPTAPRRSAAFAKGGIYVLAAAGTHVVVRCGDVGQNGNGGHAHNDLLSYELSHNVPIIVDPGTYIYSGDPKARDEFRATAAHNTVVVNGEEQNPIPHGQLFRLTQVATPTLVRWEASADAVTLVASHDGYRRLTPPVDHRRRFHLDRSSGELKVTDELHGSGAARAECRLHLATGIDSRLTGTRAELFGGEATIEFDGEEVLVSLEEGWVSPRYGVRVRAPVLVARLAGRLPLELSHTIKPNPL
jgi:uncharacterized heparinase superfamily protein